MRALALFAVLACGCGAATDGPCAQRGGTYRLNFTERSGTCGTLSEQIGTFDGQPAAPPPPCTSGEIRYSADNCEVTNVNIVCPEDGIGPGVTSTSNGKYSWSADGAHGSGQLAIVAKDASGVVLCNSSYDVVATRL